MNPANAPDEIVLYPSTLPGEPGLIGYSEPNKNNTLFVFKMNNPTSKKYILQVKLTTGKLLPGKIDDIDDRF